MSHLEEATKNRSTHSFYVVESAKDQYFAGFNPEKGKADFVSNPLEAKLFSNKHEIKLRPTEQIVELIVSLTPTNTVVSDPFRPKYRKPKDVK